jgi:hypothetical protein
MSIADAASIVSTYEKGGPEGPPFFGSVAGKPDQRE